MKHGCREAETIGNKALLGDAKAKAGLAFLYEPPAGFLAAKLKGDAATAPKVLLCLLNAQFTCLDLVAVLSIGTVLSHPLS